MSASTKIPIATPSYGSMPIPEPVVIDGQEEGTALLLEDQEQTYLAPHINEGPKYRDVAFSILFYIHLAIMIFLGVQFGSFQPPAYVAEEFSQVDITNVSQWRDIVQDSSPDADPQSQMSDEDWEKLQTFIYQARNYLEVYPERILMYLVIPMSVLAYAIAYAANALVIPCCPRTMVMLCLLGSFAWIFVGGILACITAANWFVLVGAGGVLFLATYFIRSVWRFIPFAAANLKVGLQGLNANSGMYLIAIVFSVLGFLWNIFWAYTLLGVAAYEDGEFIKTHPDAIENRKNGEYEGDDSFMAGFRFFLFLVSLYWTNTILLNTVQVTIAGVMGTWCYVKEEAAFCCSPAVTGSFMRSITYSFGSICMGSLLQAVVSAIRHMLENTRRQQQQSGSENASRALFLCVLECLVKCLDEIIEYFNQWAYVYVGLYGYSYLDSGKRVVELFKARGWSNLVTNNLVNYVIAFTNFTVGVVSGLMAVLIEFSVTHHLSNDSGESFLFGPVPYPSIWSFVIGLLIGTGVCSVMMNVVKGAVNSLIVCFADDPAKMEANHPDETKLLMNAWQAVFSDTGVQIASSQYNVDV